MGEDIVRRVLERELESPVEVGTYRGVEGVWAKVELDPRIDNSMRPTSLACDGTTVEEMKVRFVATTADHDAVVATLSALADTAPAAGAVSAENHELAEGDELWPHIQYEHLALSEAATVLAAIEAEQLPNYEDD